MKTSGLAAIEQRVAAQRMIEFDDAEALFKEIRRLQALLDAERHVLMGRYAFCHRNLALFYVRQQNAALYDEAVAYAHRRIDEDGGRSFQDVVAALEAEIERLRAENAFLREWLRGELTISDAEINEELARGLR